MELVALIMRTVVYIYNRNKCSLLTNNSKNTCMTDAELLKVLFYAVTTTLECAVRFYL